MKYRIGWQYQEGKRIYNNANNAQQRIMNYSRRTHILTSFPCAFLSEHHAMKVYCGNGGIAPRIL
jgi:hypothetical protein